MELGGSFVDVALGTTYWTGELAPVSGVYELVGHETPANARCVAQRRVWGVLVEGYSGSGGEIQVREGTPLPRHGPCGQGALWCLTWASGWGYVPRRSVASRRTVAVAHAP